MSGFITIERNTWDHPVLARSEMSETEAWTWMIARATWAGTTHMVGDSLVNVERGSFMITLRKLQSEFMWKSDKRVRNFLKKLENHGMLAVQTLGQRNARKTHVTICNYDKYQSDGRSKDAAKTHDGRTTDAVKKQGNKVTKDTNVSLDAKVAAILSQAVSQELVQDFIASRREMKKPITERAARSMLKDLIKHHDPNAVVRASVSNGWQGIFPDKIKPQLKAINGGQNERFNQHPDGGTRPDPAIEQIARLAGLGTTSGNGGF